MITSFGRFARQHNRKGYFAGVTVTIDRAVTETRISVGCHGRGFHGQGYVEEVPERGYDSWKQGAVIGVDYALRVCASPPCEVVITKIEGLTTDTNPTVVAAAMDAIWKALSFLPPSDVKAHVEETVFDSWNRPYEALPAF